MRHTIMAQRGFPEPARPIHSVPGSKIQGRSSRSSMADQKTAWLHRDKSEHKKTFVNTDLVPVDVPVTSEAGYELLATYNWIDTSSPSIYVPGAPRVWRPLELPRSVRPDSGKHYIDLNAYKASKYPFEPLFRALDVMRPNMDCKSVDVVANRNSLRHLLDFALGRVYKHFRIDLCVIHNTLFLVRREKRSEQTYRSSQSPEWGHNFERDFTEPIKGQEDSFGHHRIVRYQLGDLSCMIRFEVDACLSEEVSISSSATPGPSGSSVSQVEGPEALLAQLSLADSPQNSVRKTGINHRRTKTVFSGQPVLSPMVEIKTSAKRKKKLNECMPQLWFGRIPHLYVGKHTAGVFNGIEHDDASAQFQSWEAEEKTQVALRKMVGLINELRQVALQKKGQMFMAVCDHKNKPLKLQVFESRSRLGVLPQEIVARFWAPE